MSTAKELKIKEGNEVILTDQYTTDIMSGLGGMTGIPVKEMIGRKWRCIGVVDRPPRETLYKFNPLNNKGHLMTFFTWTFSQKEDAFLKKVELPTPQHVRPQRK